MKPEDITDELLNEMAVAAVLKMAELLGDKPSVVELEQVALVVHSALAEHFTKFN